MDKLLKGLNPQQKAAVLHVEGTTAVIAGAGSGKTRTLTKKIVYLIKNLEVLPWRILALTFTNKAATEMKERVEQEIGHEAQKTHISTYHSFCLRILREEIHHLGIPSSFGIVDNLDQKQILSKIYKSYELSPKTLPYKTMLDFISKNKISKNTPASLIEESFLDNDKIKAKIYQEYQQEIKNSNTLDFDDLLLYVEEVFTKHPLVVTKWSGKFDYFLVDEFQDTSHIQYKIIQKICNNKSITVVGDPDQTIYTWRNADANFMNNPQKFFQNVSIVKLEENYRSTKKILNAANNLIRHNLERIPKKLYSSLENGEDISFYHGFSEDDEARFIAEKISELARTEPLRNVAVLYRANYLSQSVEKQLVAHNIQYVIFGGVKFYQRKEIKDVIAFMKVMDNEDAISLQRIINVPSRQIGSIALEKIMRFASKNKTTPYLTIAKHLDALDISPNQKTRLRLFVSCVENAKKQLQTASIAQTIKVFLDKISYTSAFSPEESFGKTENVNELLKSIDKWESEKVANNNPKTLRSFVEEISLYTGTEEDPKQNKNDYVSLMTIHSAKGLEFQNVFIIGLSEGVFPSAKSLSVLTKKTSNLEEERRLAYVAVTRAKKRLYLSNSKGYVSFNKTSQKTPSRFLKEMQIDLTKSTNYSSFDFKPEDKYLEKEPNFVEGDLVNHEKFGNGQIISLDDNLVTVAFNSKAGVKTLMKNHKSIKRRV